MHVGVALLNFFISSYNFWIICGLPSVSNLSDVQIYHGSFFQGSYFCREDHQKVEKGIELTTFKVFKPDLKSYYSIATIF